MAKNKSKKKTRSPQRFIKSSTAKIIIFLLATILYCNTLGHDYVLDDAILITENTLTQAGIKAIPDILSHDTFYGFFNTDAKANLVSGGRYRPFSQILFAIEQTLFGNRPFWGHLINILCFAICAISVFHLLLDLIYPHIKYNNAILIAFASSILFVAHPIHTEVVANIKGRDEILALLFSTWSLIFALRSSTKRGLRDFVVATMLFFLALLSKEVAVGFLVITPLAYYFFREENVWSSIRTVFPLLVAFLFYLGLRFSVLGWNISGSPPLELMNNPFLKFQDGSYVLMSPMEKWPQIIFGLGKYLQLSFLPYPLTHDYYPQHLQVSSFADWRVIISGLGLLAVIILSLKYVRKEKLLVFGVCFFFASLFITSNIIFPVGTHLSERFLFTPSVGVCLLLSVICFKFGHSKRSLGTMIWTLLVIFFAAMTIHRNTVWKDNFTLFTTDVQTSSQSAKAQNAAGGILIDHARTLTDTSQQNALYRDALGHLAKAIALHPTYKNAHLLLGNAHYYLQEFADAIGAYDRALAVDPNYFEAKQNRAISQRDWGRYHGEKLNDLPKAIQLLENAVVILKEDYETHRLLGVAYGNMANITKAIEHFSVAVKQRADDPATLFNLGMAYMSQGDSINANHYISQAKRINPEIGH